MTSGGAGRILGITDGVASGAAVLEDGRVLAATSEERHVRMKMARGFPARSIAEVLRLSGTRPNEIEAVAVAGLSEFFVPVATEWNGWFRRDRGFLREALLVAGSEAVSFLGPSRVFQRGYYAMKSLATSGRHRAIRNALRDRFGIEAPVRFHEHHHCHATAAYYHGGAPDALVVTLDGGGDAASAEVWRGAAGRLEKKLEVPAYDSVGNYYAYVTHLLGFAAHRHEGKVTGLAAFGKPIHAATLREFIANRDGRIANTGRAFFGSALRKLRKRLPSDFAKEDLAASAQTVLEEVSTRFVAHHLAVEKLAHVRLAGGVFANVRLNQKVLEIPGVESVFVFPAMGDEGLSVGAALAEWALRARAAGRETPVRKLADVFWGGPIGEREAEAALVSAGVPHRRVAPIEIEKEVAKLLARGEAVARVAGRMEYGPRALGHRSLLYRPDDRSANDWMNRGLHRTEFMPFAPVVTAEAAPRYFQRLRGAEDAVRFMTITLDATPEGRRALPGVVHVDGTARPQVAERGSAMHRILAQFEALTGVPALVNTSYNMHEEPIVATAEDAVRAHRAGGFFHLALGDSFLVPPSRGKP